MQNVANAAAVNVNVSVSRKMRCFVFRVCWSDVFNFSFYSKPKLWVFFSLIRHFSFSLSLSRFLYSLWMSEWVCASSNIVFTISKYDFSFVQFFSSLLLQRARSTLYRSVSTRYIYEIYIDSLSIFLLRFTSFWYIRSHLGLAWAKYKSPSFILFCLRAM